MNISKRQREILEFLLQQTKEVTAGDIAARINVSTRTILRELSALEEKLVSYGVEIKKKSGIGIYLDADPSCLSRLRQQLFQVESMEWTPEERKIYALSLLLDDNQEPIKLLAIASDLKVTVVTVSHDLDELQSWIEEQGLVLVRRRGYGVEITGSESHIRRAMVELAMEHLDESDLFGARSEHTNSKANDKLLEIIGHGHVLKVENALWQPDIEWLENMPERQYMRLLLQLSVMAARVNKGRAIENDMPHVQISEDSVPEYMALRLCTILASELGIELDLAERKYVHGLLIEARQLMHTTRLLPVDDLLVLDRVVSLIDSMEKITHYDFHEDRLLREGLIAHMEPVLERIEGRQLIRNPLLQQIRQDYEALFADVKRAVNQAWHGIEVPDEEIGFLVMHFGASIERLRTLKREVRAVIVCTSGIGSSRMLSSRLAKEIPEIRIVDSVSWYEAARIPKEQYDLVLSTVDLPMEKHQYYKVSPLLTGEESEQLRHFIKTTTLQREHSPPSSGHSPVVRETQWSGLEAMLVEIVRIIGEFQVFPLDNKGLGLDETVYAMCKIQHERGVLQAPHKVTKLLEARENAGSQKIPGTSLALFHTRSEGIYRATISLFQLTQPLLMSEDDPEGVSHVLLMLGPWELSKESLEVLSEISALLLQEEMIELLEKGNRDDLIHYLSRELVGFYRSKTEIGGQQP